MNRTDALKEALTEDAFGREPLALAIISYLRQEDPDIYRKVVTIFDCLMSNRLDEKIKEYSDEMDSEETQIFLKAGEVAELMGCSPRWVRKLAGEQKLPGYKRMNTDGSMEWVFPLENLGPHLQQRYFQSKS